MTEQEGGTKTADSMWRWWPCFIGGFCGPILAHFLSRWAPAYVATGIAFFVMWFVVGLLFTFSPPSRTWSLVRWTSFGALGAVVAGAVALAIL